MNPTCKDMNPARNEIPGTNTHTSYFVHRLPPEGRHSDGPIIFGVKSMMLQMARHGDFFRPPKFEVQVHIVMWISRCTYMANHFPDTRGNPEAKPKYLRDSEGLAATRMQSYRNARKRKAPVVPIQPGDLSRCPRWQQLRQRILEKAQRRMD